MRCTEQKSFQPESIVVLTNLVGWLRARHLLSSFTCSLQSPWARSSSAEPSVSKEVAPGPLQPSTCTPRTSVAESRTVEIRVGWQSSSRIICGYSPVESNTWRRFHPSRCLAGARRPATTP
ncbi:unnamed protein product [Prorocentrum cordatum]|uniref:Uncharacterized protein n=1 Tax=Prorocentrum cordatum TaxID=2364126 RepID=A0ABN9RX70_9DINO|nr:unnamed protein product [Polarella glacialis]